MTSSTWAPQPAQVTLPQEWQGAGLHMADSFEMVDSPIAE
jgi:hypothetical protein